MAGTGSLSAPPGSVRGERRSEAALAAHLLVGLAWAWLLTGVAAAAGGAVASIWLVAAGLLWVVAARELQAPERRRSAVQIVSVWWLQSWLAPLFAGLAVVRLVRARGAGVVEATGPREAREDGGVSAESLDARIDALQRALDSLRPDVARIQRHVADLARELEELRASAAGAAARPVPPPAADRPPRPPHPAPAAPSPARATKPTPPQRWPEPPLEPTPAPASVEAPPRRDVELAELLGARALAWAGGVVTLLGVVFFFVLAVDRGWIGPLERVGLGAAASALLLASGVVVRRRHGDVYSALAAAGAGIAGGYATLLAAAALYALVGDLPALLLAAAIATAGAAVALRWDAQMLAGIGLVGATLVPLTLVFEGGLSAVGTGFVALVFAATAAVAIRRDWRPVLAAGLAASALQIWLLILDRGDGAGASVLVLAAAFAALYVAAAILLGRRTGRLERLAASLVLVSGSVAAVAATLLLDGTLWGVDRRGVGLLAAAAAYALCAAALHRRARDLAALVGAVALALAAVGVADVLTGNALAVAWSAQASVLAWLGARLREPRYRLASLGYLVLAGAYALGAVAPPAGLFRAGESPAAGVPSLLALGLAALVFARYAQRWETLSGDGAVARALDALTRLEASWRLGAQLLAPLAGVYALSLLVLAAVGELGASPPFAWGHVAVTAVWTAGGGALLLAGLLLARRPLQLAAVAWVAGALLKITVFDIGAIPPRHAAWSALALGIGAAAAAYGAALLRARSRFDVAAAALGGTVVSGAFVLGALAELLPRGGALDPRGSGVLAAGTLYALLGATLFPLAGRRDAATAFWGTGLPLALLATFLLLDSPTAAVAAWSAGAAALALLGAMAGERRLTAAAGALAALAVGRTLVELAPPADLFVPATGAADGVPALAAALAGALAVVAARSRVRGPAEDRVDAALDRFADGHRAHALAAVAVLGVYGVSLSILGLAQALGGGDVTTDFQRGHTAVSALWGLVGLLALRFGLTAARPSLKLAGFALFGVALAKLFLYDLTMLSSVTRALSFLAVGAVLLVAGFFYQRLGARATETT